MILTVVGCVGTLGMSAAVYFLWRSRRHWKQKAVAEGKLRVISETAAANATTLLRIETQEQQRLKTYVDTIQAHRDKLQRLLNTERETLTTAVAASAAGDRSALEKLLAEAHSGDSND